jgi:hypothetical protein
MSRLLNFANEEGNLRGAVLTCLLLLALPTKAAARFERKGGTLREIGTKGIHCLLLGE